MSIVFQSLGELSDYAAGRGGIEIVDPGVPLEDLTVGARHVWASQPSVRKVVGFIARNIASVPLHVYERVSDTDRQRVTDHPLAAVLGEPAPQVTPFRFWELVLIDWLLDDRWLVQKVPTSDGGLELVRIPPRKFRFGADGLDRVVSVRLHQRGEWREHDPSEFLFDHGYAARGANGTSPMETLRDILAESSEAVSYRRSVWRNGARVPGWLSRPSDAPQWSNDARTRFLNGWKTFIRGGGQEGGTPLLEDGMTYHQSEAFSPRDAQDLDGRKLTDAEVAAAYHIAPELVGAREGTYSNIEAYRQMLYRDNLGPHITAFEQVINTMLVPDLADGRTLYVEAHVEAKLRGSFEEQARVLQSAVGGPWMLRSEARARMNLPQVDGTEQLIVPLNVIEGGQASPRDSAPKAKDLPGAKDLEEGLAPVEREREALEAELAAYQRSLAADLLDAFGVKNSTDLAEAFDLEARNAELAAVIAGRQRRIAQAGALEVLDEWNPSHEGWAPEVMDAWLAKAAVAKAELANRGLYDRLAEAVVGDSWESGLVEVLSSPAWAALWAVTIATSASSFGRQDAARASGLTTKTWRTRSGNPRPEHAALDGVTIPINGIFLVGGRWPGDPFMPPEQNANCKCVLTYGRGDI